MELEVVVRFVHFIEQTAQANERPLVERLKLIPLNDRIVHREIVQNAQQETEGVAETTIGIGSALQDVLRDAHILRIIDARNPQAQHVSAVLVHDLSRIDAVTKRLRHLVAILVHREAAVHDRFVGRRFIGADRREQRRLEPATMLVGTFKVEIGRETQARTLLTN